MSDENDMFKGITYWYDTESLWFRDPAVRGYRISTNDNQAYGIIYHNNSYSNKVEELEEDVKDVDFS